MLDMNRLRVFRAVVASGSVQAAAQNLGYTPSTISQHVTALQRETGLTLFEKAGRGIVPTAQGRLLYEASAELMGNIARLGGVVDDLRRGHRGRLSLASFASAAEAWVPTVARTLQGEFPGLVLDFTLNETEATPGAGSVDIDVRTEPSALPPLAVRGHSRHALSEEGYVAVLPPGHRLAGASSVALGSLADEPWVNNDASGHTCAEIIGRACGAAGFEPRYVAMSNDHHTAIAFVRAGIGLALLPELATGWLPAELSVVRVTDPEPRRRVVALVKDSSAADPAVRRALVLLRELGRAGAGAGAVAEPA